LGNLRLDLKLGVLEALSRKLAVEDRLLPAIAFLNLLPGGL